MAIPISFGPQQNAAAKNRETTGPDNFDKPVHPSESRPSTSCLDAEKKRAAVARPAATGLDDTKNGPEPAQPAATHCGEEAPEFVQWTAAAPSCDNSSAPDGGKAKDSRDESPKNCGARDVTGVASDSGGLEPKKRLQAAAAATQKRGGREEEGPEEDPAAVCDKKCKRSSEAAATFCKNPSARDDGEIKELGIRSAKNSGAPNVAAVTSNSVCLEPKKRLQLAAAAAAATTTSSGKKRGEEAAEANPTAACAPGDRQSAAEGGSSKHRGSSCQSTLDSKKDGDEIGVGVRNFISQPWMQQQRRPEGPGCSWNKTSFLNRLFECCGLVDLIIGKDLKLPHVNEQRTPISEAEGHYKIKESVMKELSELYSSFRVVLGEGECFYRSFIYSYMELVLDNDDISEESRLLCAIEEVSLACMGLEWLYDDFYKPYTAFKELLQKVKSWKTETREVRKMLLLKYFGDYKETEAIFSFLRISSAAWILTNPEFWGFHAIEDGITLEEFCRSQILQSRSYADNLAITALADALGIEIRIFCLATGQYQDMCIRPSSQRTANPRVSLLYTGIHYDILYPS